MILRRIVRINLNDYCNHDGWYVFPLDGDKNFCYRCRMTYNAFFNSFKKRNKDKVGGFLYYGNLDELGLKEENRLADLLNKPHPKWIEFSDIWEFYKHIGYDYKSKKYIGE